MPGSNAKMPETRQCTAVDPNSGFCRSNSVFYSKRRPLSRPSNPLLDVTTFISSRAHKGKTAFVDAASGRRLSFPELWRAVDCVATCLSQMGVRKGHVILVLSPNSIFVPVACLSVMSLGAIITTANPLNTPTEIAKQISDSKPLLAFTTHQLVSKLAASSGSALPVVLMDEGDLDLVQEFEILGKLEDMMRKETCGGRVKERVQQDDTATVLYSSGTTGASKGVISSHRNLITVVENVVAQFKCEQQEAEEQRFLCTVPMFHIYGLVVFVIGVIASGSMVIVLSKFEMHEMLSAIEKYRATFLPLAPPILMAMMNGADEVKGKYDLSSLQSILCGGASLGWEVIEGFEKRYPTVKILQGYALTESTGAGASMNTLEESKRYGSVGLLAPIVEAKIVEPDGCQALGVNQMGELWLRGPSVMKGYLGNDEATSLTIDSEGWLKTGDLCYFDSDGFLFIVDRLKELIKYKGYQVPPAELEALLLSHPDIADAAVIPFPDKEVGQYPMAYVVRRAGSDISERSIMDFVAGQVAPFKKIRKVAFIASIPKNPSGKVLRKNLVKLANSKV